MGDQATEVEAAALKLKLTAVPIVSALRLDEEADDFEVLVRVDAPLQAVVKHRPIDLVAAVDVSGSMGTIAVNGEKSRMDYLKAALRFIINELHDDDRLSIISFNQGVKDRSELSPMSGGGRESARRSVNSLSPGGFTAFKPALEMAARILEQRDEESKSRRVPFIIFLSDGEETKGLATRWDEVISGDNDHPIMQVLRRYPVHTFGFSSDHDPMALLAIARVSCGTYSYIDHNLDKIMDAFAVCLGGLSTVVVVDATITLSAALGVTIVGIDSGGYDKRHIGASGEVCIPVLYRGEVKNFIVHLRVPRAEAAGEQLLLTAGGTYIDDTGASTSATIANHHQLSIQRPAGGYDGNDQQHDEAVLEQVIRFRLLSLLEMLPKDRRLNNEGRKWAQWLREKWNELKNSSSLSNNFDKDVEVMVGKLEEGNGQAFVCSYVSSHQTERPTTMGSPCRIMIATPAITRKAEKAAALKPLEAPALRATTAKPHPAPPAPNAGGHIAATTAKPHPAPAANKGGGDGDIAGGVKEKRKESLSMNRHSGTGLPRDIPFHLLEEITNGFSDERKLGSGAFGKVYMGVPKDGEKIAVKMLYDMPGLDEEQFLREFNNLSRLQHQNIVRLVGYCHEIRETCVEHNGRMIFAERIRLALCFEYMTFGSLDKYLSDEHSGLDWNVRYTIIKGICKGLKYLHEELRPPIYHLDLKPANILLDENMLPKIADFGLSRFFADERSRITGSHIGTHGYLPPEYIERNIISDKFDIFSLGVVIIKIVTGPKGYNTSAEMPPQEFVERAHKNWRERLRATPMHLFESYSKQVKKCVEIALSSVVAERHKRPTIGDIVRKLDDDTETDSQILTTSSKVME